MHIVLGIIKIVDKRKLHYARNQEVGTPDERISVFNNNVKY